MARLITTLCLLCMTVACTSTPKPQPFAAGEGDLTVELLGFRNQQGQVIASLFASAAGFPDRMDKALQNRIVTLDADRVEMVFQNLPYGAYALSILHDENRDRRMETSWLGQPQEGFGFSGQPDYTFGPPDFAAARILLLSPERRLTIQLRYETSRREKQEQRRPRGAGNS